MFWCDQRNVWKTLNKIVRNIIIELQTVKGQIIFDSKSCLQRQKRYLLDTFLLKMAKKDTFRWLLDTFRWLFQKDTLRWLASKKDDCHPKKITSGRIIYLECRQKFYEQKLPLICVLFKYWSSPKPVFNSGCWNAQMQTIFDQ